MKLTDVKKDLRKPLKATLSSIRVALEWLRQMSLKKRQSGKSNANSVLRLKKILFISWTMFSFSEEKSDK